MMNELVKYLVEGVLSDYKINKVIAIYAGRFQPPGLHHFEVFKKIQNEYGKDNSFIATSDKVEMPKSPLDFKDKQNIWAKYGVDSSKVVQVKNPYVATEILSKFDPETTAVIFFFGDKDKDRIKQGTKKDGSPSYFQKYIPGMPLQNIKNHGYFSVAPNVSVKVRGRDLSGTEIRNLLGNKSMSKEAKKLLFKEIFGWFDETIFNKIVPKFEEAESNINEKISINEGGKTFDTNNSVVKKEYLNSTIEYNLKNFGLKNIPFSIVGNIYKPFFSDIDIAIDESDLCKFLKIPENSDKDTLYGSLDKYLKTTGKVYHLNKGLNICILQGSSYDEHGQIQPAIDKEGHIKNEDSKIQIDIFLGNRKWSENYLSGVKDSKYKAAVRNILLTNIVASIIFEKNNGEKQKFLISPKDGLYLVTFTVNEKGARKELSRKIVANDANEMIKLFFGDKYNFEKVNNFEKLYAALNSPDFRFKKYLPDILSKFKEQMSKITDYETPKLNESKKKSLLFEEKMSIKRFSGTNELSDIEFLKFLYKISPLIKDEKIDLSVSDNISVTEKLDGSPCKFGLNNNQEFFIESANSGEITKSNVSKFNNPVMSHFYEAFNYLNSYKQFQDKLKNIYSKFGSFRISSEMFPVLNHIGDELGDIIFCSTKYNKKKLGNKGCFVCFSAEPSDEIINLIEDTKSSEWKIYNISKHGNLEKEGLVFDVSGIKSLISSEDKLRSSIDILKLQNKSNEESRNILKDIIKKVKLNFQSVLNKYAEKINSFLSLGNSPVEGVVMKINLPDESLFFKGTSEIFHKIAEQTWGTRKSLATIEDVFEGSFLTKVLGLTNNKVILNKTIENAAKKLGINSITKEEDLNKISIEVYKSIKNDNVDLNPSDVYKRAINVFKKAEIELLETLKKWREIKKNLDPDTISKTDKQIVSIREKFNKIKQKIEINNNNKNNYVIYLLRMLIDRRIKNRI